MNEQITILAQRYWPDAHGGVETHLRCMATELARLGCQVEVRAENRSGAPDREEIAPNLVIRRYPPAEPGQLWRWQPLVHANAWRRHLAMDPPKGWIWASNPLLATAALLAGCGERMIFNPAGCTAAMHSIGRLYPHVNTMQPSKLIRWMDRYAWQKSTYVVLSSNNLRAQFHRHHNLRDNVYVLPLAMNERDSYMTRNSARRTWGIPPSAFVAGFVGRLDPCKAIDHLLDAFAHGGFQPDSRILLVGDGPDRKRLQRRIYQLSLQRHVIWAGRMADPTQAYAAMDAMVLPSVYEAYGLAMVEAMAAGTPALGRAGNGRTILTASDEIIEDGRTGLLFDSHDPADLSRKLRALEQDPVLRREMGAAARRWASSRTWTAYASHLFDLLSSEFGGSSNRGGMRNAA